MWWWLSQGFHSVLPVLVLQFTFSPDRSCFHAEPGKKTVRNVSGGLIKKQLLHSGTNTLICQVIGYIYVKLMFNGERGDLLSSPLIIKEGRQKKVVSFSTINRSSMQLLTLRTFDRVVFKKTVQLSEAPSQVQLINKTSKWIDPVYPARTNMSETYSFVFTLSPRIASIKVTVANIKLK